ncbi:MAG: hypothetical protein ACXVEQ_00300 [Nocardioidaceae bacterium]
MTKVIARPSRRALLGLSFVLALGVLVGVSHSSASAAVEVTRSVVKGTDGKSYWVTNHLVKSVPEAAAAAAGKPAGHHKYLLVWAGDANAADTKGSDIENEHVGISPVKALHEDAVDGPPAPDFLAVIDADRRSKSYGKVVNTATVGPLEENEPHHMQYVWHKGDRIYAGGLFSSATYVFNVNKLPAISLSGVSLPTDTKCGSIPDAFWTLHDGTAYGTYMGGPVAAGACQYSNGQTRLGNGYGGSPGEVVHFSKSGKVLSESPAASSTSEDPSQCPNYPAIPGQATCANPHGIQVRQDLNRMVTSDYAEPRNIVLDPVKPADNKMFRSTVRIWDTSKENDPRVVSVSSMPNGPRTERNPGHEEPTGIMETTVTNRHRDKGAFAESMCGGVIYYTPDITKKKPAWREVFDDTTASKQINPNVTEGAGCDGGGWLQTSQDDHYLYHAVIGRNPGALAPDDTGSPKMVYVLDVHKLIASAEHPTCKIDDIREVYNGGSESDCPKVASVLPVPDGTSGGPHWGALDNFRRTASGTFAETKHPANLAFSDYFVARTGVDGDHKVCMANIGPGGKLTLDRSFIDENEGTPCVDFDRTTWPQGDVGNAKPHSELFVVH